MSLSNSLSCALEDSIKLWQPLNSRIVRELFRNVNGAETIATDSRLGAAMDYSWTLEFDSQMSPDDRRSLSTGSCTLRPFGLACNASNSFSQSPSSSSSSCSALETYSRKVFVGGLPPDIAHDEIKDHFVRFGPLTVDWPYKTKTKAKFPPKGYVFLLFCDELAVERLIKSCFAEEGKLFMFVSSVTQSNKKVQIRPWKLSDSDYIMDHTQPIDPRKTIFIGGVPRPLKACELADIFNSRYGNVCYAGIDCDPELKYPKGAGRVTFSSRVSFMTAVSCRFLKVTYEDINKKVEVKPYVLDAQVCDECRGLHCGGCYAPYFCGSIHCLRYYCEHCWTSVHSVLGTQNHCCFTKKNRGYV